MASIREVLLLCQKSPRSDPFVVLFKKLYSDAIHKDFALEFFKHLQPVLVVSRQEVACSRILEVTTKFAITLNDDYSKDANEDCEILLHPFLRDLFLFLIKVSKSVLHTIRVNALKLLSKLLKQLNELRCEQTLLDKLYKMASERLKDTSSHVRAEAVLAVCYLQDPTCESCPIIKDFLHLLSCDPYHITRRNVAQVLAITSSSLSAIKRRLLDVHPLVRKVALSRISEKVSIRCFSLSERVEILKICFEDHTLKPVMKQKLLPGWLKNCNNDIIKFLSFLDIESSPKVIQQSMNLLFELDDIRVLAKKLDLDPQLHVLPKEKIKDESVFFWRCLCQYVRSLKGDLAIDMVDELTPTISDFCDYFESFVEEMKKSSDIAQHVFTFEQLLILAEELDFCDTFGLKRLQSFILDTLRSPSCLVEMIEPLVNCFRTSHANQSECLQVMIDLSFELCQPFMNENEDLDEISLMKLQRGLKIAVSAFKVKPVGDIPLQLVEFKEALLLPCLVHSHSNVRLAAVEALGLYSLFSVQEARETYCYFMHALSYDEEVVQVAALKAAFDILLYFGPNLVAGLSSHEFVEKSDSFVSTPEEEDLFLLFHEKLTPMLDSEEPEVRKVAVKGMAKLLLWGRISSAPLFCRLFLMCYTEIYEDNLEIQRFLTTFVAAYASSNYLKPECLEDAFMISLEAIFEAPRSSVISKVDAFTVGVALLQLAGLIKSACVNKGNIIHDHLAPRILEKILEKPRVRYVGILTRFLNNLQLTGENSKELVTIVHKVLKEVKNGIALKSVRKFLNTVSNLIPTPSEILEKNSEESNSLHEKLPCSEESDNRNTDVQVIAEASVIEVSGANSSIKHSDSVTTADGDVEIVIPESPAGRSDTQEKDISISDAVPKINRSTSSSRT